jgi:hypothetical protein
VRQYQHVGPSEISNGHYIGFLSFSPMNSGHYWITWDGYPNSNGPYPGISEVTYVQQDFG